MPEDIKAPVLRQYREIRKRFPDTILLFRLGDFYEAYERDADIVNTVLGIMPGMRNMGDGVMFRMVAIPHDTAEASIGALINAGHKAAICEQVGWQNRV